MFKLIFIFPFFPLPFKKNFHRDISSYSCLQSSLCSYLWSCLYYYMFFLFYNCTFYACLNVLVLAFTCLFMYIRTCLYTIFYINIVFILVNIYMSKTFFSIHLSLYTSLLILVCAIVYASLFFDYTFPFLVYNTFFEYILVSFVYLFWKLSLYLPVLLVNTIVFYHCKKYRSFT